MYNINNCIYFMLMKLVRRKDGILLVIVFNLEICGKIIDNWVGNISIKYK